MEMEEEANITEGCQGAVSKLFFPPPSGFNTSVGGSEAAEMGVCPTEAGYTRCDFNSLIGPQQAALDDTDSINLSTTRVRSVHAGCTIAGSRGLHH